MKSSLTRQPALRLVWEQAYKALSRADRVAFLGYSLPRTDIAAETLFSEALKDFPPDDVQVVSLAGSDDEATQGKVKHRYREVLGAVPDARFDFRGVQAWSRELDSRMI